MAAISRPNIVLLHVHDLGRWLSCYSRPSVPSGNLQRFADEAIVFHNAFATAPLCTPARGSLFTGVMPHEHGLMGLAHAGWHYSSEVDTLPELLTDLGYLSTLIGLQHEDPDPRMVGFEDVRGLGFLPTANHVVDESIRWLEEYDSKQPFFLSVGIWEVHRPWDSKDYPEIEPSMVEVPGYLDDTPAARDDLADFYGSIAYMDEHVGRLLETLSQAPFTENTLVIFTTDHGAAFPGAKGTLYDPGLEVALIVKPPSSWHWTPIAIDSMASHLDLVPTCIDAAGGEIPAACSGQSLLPVLRDGIATVPNQRSLYAQKTFHDGYDPIRSVRTDDWKYIRNFRAGMPKLQLSLDLERSKTRSAMGDDHLQPRAEEELYFLVDDPWEKMNLAGDPEHEAARAEMESRLVAEMTQRKDPLLKGEIADAIVPHRRDQ